MPVGQKEPNNWQAEMAAAARRLITAAQRTPQAVRFPPQKGSGIGLRADSGPRGFALS